MCRVEATYLTKLETKPLVSRDLNPESQWFFIMAYVYKHIRKDTNKVFYIGIGKTKRRINSSSNRNKHWINIVNKVGFYSEIIEDNLSWEAACEKEKYWINYYGRKDLNEGILVNMTNGGDGVNGHSEELKHKIGSYAKGRIVSDETKQKISKKCKNPSKETREKIGLAHKNKVVSNETRLKLSIKNKNCKPPSQKGTIRSDENKKKISDKLTGRVLSKEHCERIAIASANRSDEAKKNKSEGVKRWWANRKNNKL
jgi:hypothetical protein